MRLEWHPWLEHHGLRSDEPEAQRLVDDPGLAEAALGVVVEVLVHPGLGAYLYSVHLRKETLLCFSEIYDSEFLFHVSQTSVSIAFHFYASREQTEINDNCIISKHF